MSAEGRVQPPEGMWVCRCNYQNIGPICTHCGWVPEPASGRACSWPECPICTARETAPASTQPRGAK